MKFEVTPLEGVWKILLDPIHDTRGSFTRLWDADTLTAHGLHSHWVQENLSLNTWAGTLRGLHFQIPPCEEIKLVRCSRGKLWDVVLDLRSHSPSYGRWAGFELSENRAEMIYIPTGCAHGFQTLNDSTEVAYHMSHAYQPASAAGLNGQDPFLAIPWPLPVSCVSERDKSLPFWDHLENPWI